MPTPSALAKRESRLAKADQQAIEALAEMFRVEIDDNEIEDGDLEAYAAMLAAEKALEEDMTGEDDEDIQVIVEVPILHEHIETVEAEESEDEKEAEAEEEKAEEEEEKREKEDKLDFEEEKSDSEEEETQTLNNSFVQELRHRPFVHQLMLKIRELGMSNLQLCRLILYQECKSHEKTAPFADITHGSLEYRFVLDAINKALDSPAGSPLIMSLRAKQMTCSASFSVKSTAHEIPTVGSNLRDGITYDERSALFFKQRSELLKYSNGIFDRTNIGLTFLEHATPIKRLLLLQQIEDYAQHFASIRTDMRPALFGISKDLDPTRTPLNLGDKFRETIHAFSSRIVHKQTTLKDSSGARLPFHGAFWVGSEPLKAGQNLGYYEGRILTECDNTQLFSERPSEYSLLIEKYKVLVDSSNAADSNWTRYINDGGRTGEENQTNLIFARDGSVVTTRTVEPNSELFVTYGDDFWSWFK